VFPDPPSFVDCLFEVAAVISVKLPYLVRLGVRYTFLLGISAHGFMKDL